MKILRLIGIGLGLALIVAILQLPDPGRNMYISRYATLPEADLHRMTSESWKSGGRGKALLILDYMNENKIGDQAALGNLREAYLHAMLEDKTAVNQLAGIGYENSVNRDWYGNLAGATLADWFVYGVGNQVLEEASKKSSDEFVKLLKMPLKINVIFPQVEPALRILLTARLTGILADSIVNQLSGCVRFVQTTENQAQGLTAFQESVMPIYQLAKKCRTWSEFEAIVKSAASIDQIKALTVIASATPLNTRHLAQIAAIVDNRELVGQTIGFIMKQGQQGLDNIYAALRKGKSGVQFVMEHPGLSVGEISRGKYSTTPVNKSILIKWQELHQRLGGWPLVMIKYLTVVFVLVILQVFMVPRRVLEARFATAGQTLPGSFSLYYHLGIWIISIVVVLLLMMPMATSSPAPEGSGMNGAEPANGISSQTEHNQTLSMVILAIVVLFVQGICWWTARRKLDEVAKDNISDVPQKLRRLENMEIFFDLPLYCGLALTILAFILISTFGAGVSRFLAYSSTFVGIIFSVVLRVWYVYPLREKLIVQKKI